MFQIGPVFPVVVHKLSHQACDIASILQPSAQGIVLTQSKCFVSTQRIDVTKYTMIMGGLSGHEGRPRRAAQRKIDEAISERHSILREFLNRGHGCNRSTIILIISHDDHDVRSSDGCLASKERNDQQQPSKNPIHVLPSPRLVSQSTRNY